MLKIILFIANLVILAMTILFTYESNREQEPRAPKFGIIGILLHLLIASFILAIPQSHIIISVYFGLLIITGVIFLVPTRANPQVLLGTKGFIVGDISRFDERDEVFARNETLQPDRKEYQLYYKAHPELKERDDRRRAVGGDLGNPGSIDNCHPPNMGMIFSTFEMSYFLLPHTVAEPIEHQETEIRTEMDPERATEIVKGFALQLGAGLVGVCKVDKRWIYSHRGEIHMDNWEDWGTEIDMEHLDYAVVVAVEMDNDLVISAPHTPTVVESSRNYAKESYITTTLAHWFANMGYHGSAQMVMHYDALMVPLAVEAGLGQLGRQGYLIAEKYGTRVRLGAVLTDMPLVPDKPIDLGVEEFCKTCLKCAESCPSSSIPLGEKSVVNGTQRWKLNEESCHDYWGKAGTDCAVCMAICPFGRPNRSFHRLVKWILKKSRLARLVLPYIDNIIYGRKWKPRTVPDWINYRLRE